MWLILHLFIQLELGEGLPPPCAMMRKIIVKNKKKHFHHNKGKFMILSNKGPFKLFSSLDVHCSFDVLPNDMELQIKCWINLDKKANKTQLDNNLLNIWVPLSKMTNTCSFFFFLASKRPVEEYQQYFSFNDIHILFNILVQVPCMYTFTFCLYSLWFYWDMTYTYLILYIKQFSVLSLSCTCDDSDLGIQTCWSH